MSTTWHHQYVIQLMIDQKPRRVTRVVDGKSNIICSRDYYLLSQHLIITSITCVMSSGSSGFPYWPRRPISFALEGIIGQGLMSKSVVSIQRTPVNPLPSYIQCS